MQSGRRALLLSLLAILKDAEPAGFNLPPGRVGITSGGRPPVFQGSWFYGLHAGGGRGRINTSLVQNPTIHVTITGRVNLGSDKIGPALIESEDGLDERMEALVRFLASSNRDYGWLNAANLLLGDGITTNGFKFLPITFDESEPQEVQGDWFLAGPATPGQGNRPQPAASGVKATLTIGGFERERYVETQP